MFVEKKKKYPRWAPKPVIDLRETWAELCSKPSQRPHFPSDGDLQTLDRLLEDPYMECVWQKIFNLAGEENDVVLTNFGFNVCRINHRWDAASKKTRSGLRSERQEFADNAEKLADELTESKLDKPIVGLLLAAHMEKPYANQAGIAEILDLTNADMLPSAADILRQLAKSLGSQAKQAHPVALHPARSTAKRNHFIREFEKYLRHTFGKPMHHQVSVVANAIFEGLPVGRAEVKRMCREQFAQ